jgi:AmmeMemoRadiSam system protein B
MIRTFFSGLTAVLLWTILVSCPGSGAPSHESGLVSALQYLPTFSSQGVPIPVRDTPPPLCEALPPGAVPWAGTVSHHLLAASLIDAWFATLRRSRDIELFIIISPRHWNQGVRTVSLSGLPWDMGQALVLVDLAALERLKRELDEEEDPTAFPGEHGVGTLLFSLHRHFPNARILPIIVPVDALDIETGRRLATALQIFFPPGRNHHNFLLISTDFSHHHGVAETARRDHRNRRFLETLTLNRLPRTSCDNRTGLYILSRLAGRQNVIYTHILMHTDSFHLSGQGKEDITSYFFSFAF